MVAVLPSRINHKTRCVDDSGTFSSDTTRRETHRSHLDHSSTMSSSSLMSSVSCAIGFWQLGFPVRCDEPKPLSIAKHRCSLGMEHGWKLGAHNSGYHANEKTNDTNRPNGCDPRWLHKVKHFGVHPKGTQTFGPDQAINHSAFEHVYTKFIHLRSLSCRRICAVTEIWSQSPLVRPCLLQHPPGDTR